MSRTERQELRFVHGLVAGGSALLRPDGYYVAAGPGRGAVRLAELKAQALESAGLVCLADGVCRPLPEARGWLKRALLDDGAFAAQHRVEAQRPDGLSVNLGESPLARLASSIDGQPAFLGRHHLEAGERVRRLAERAQLQPRVTMSYSAARTAGGGKAAGQATEISDMAADARRALSELHRIMPADCAGVVLDVCVFLKGLQLVESERGWPRRSAKVVLRIGLDQLAAHYGLAPAAVGAPTRRRRAWLGEGARPDVFG